MKALTVWQPWASLIIAGAKPYEFRGWRFPSSLIGERIVIHAGARPIRTSEVRDLLDRLANPRQAWSTCLHADWAQQVLHDSLPHSGRLPPLACGLGTAVLGEPKQAWAIAEEFGGQQANDSDRHAHSNWGWPLTYIEEWPEPVPMRGAQGLWTWPEPADALL